MRAWKPSATPTSASPRAGPRLARRRRVRSSAAAIAGTGAQGVGLVPQGHRPRARQDRRQARNLAELARFHRQAHVISRPRPSVQRRRRKRRHERHQGALRRPRRRLQSVPRQIPRGDAPLSDRQRQAAAVGPADAAGPLGLAGLIAFSWWSVHNHHTDWHIWSGCAILTLLLFRLLWGFVGSSTARFASFVRGPRAVLAICAASWSGIGHTPLGAISVLALLGAVAVQVGLGLIAEDEDGLYAGPLAALVSSDTSDKARDVHEMLVQRHPRPDRPARRGDPLLPLARAAPDEADDHRPRRCSLRGREPMRPGKWWVALICLADRARHHPLDHRRRAAVWSLIETRPRGHIAPC